nr:MAG: replication polyprotein [Chemarfal virus 204]
MEGGEFGKMIIDEEQDELELIRQEETIELVKPVGKKRNTKINNKENKKSSPKKFRLQSKNFFLTYPRCEVSKDEAMVQLKHLLPDIQYCAIAKELHKDGTPHLHVLLTLPKKKEITNQTFFDLGTYHGNYQSARNNEDVKEYIFKSDLTPLEYGVWESNKQTEVQKRAMDNKKIIDTPLHTLIDNGEISIYNYKQVREAKMLYNLDKIDVPDYMPKECIWIYGQTGIGKSRYIRDNFKGMFYNKPQNKWWDGYTGQTTVLIDDFDHGGSVLGHYLKIWADCYSFNAEVKGGTIRPVFDRLFVTSQYRPRDIWHCETVGKDETEMRLAIERRFRIMTIVDGVTLVDHPIINPIGNNGVVY